LRSNSHFKLSSASRASLVQVGTVADLERDLRPLSRVEYERMVDLGMFAEERVELLCGMVVRMSPHGPDRDATIERLTELLVVALHGRARVRIQSSFAASDTSEPEPDVAVVPIADYRRAHPNVAQLIVEVAGSSIIRDRGSKANVYAASGVGEYWVVNLAERTIEVRTDPAASGYRSVRVVRAHESITPLEFPDLVVAVADLFA